MATEHPYYPRNLIIPEYAPQTWTIPGLFGVFGTAVGIIALATWVFSGTIRGVSRVERSIMTWWAVTGAIHMFLEGAFVAMPGLMSDASANFFVDAWKEYAKSDSRYATRDSFIVAVEAVTALVEGPLCYVIIYAMATRKGYSQLLQLLVAFGQFYGDVLYFLTATFDGFPHSDPHPLYFWAYFVGMNSLWLLIPGLVIWHNASLVASACAQKNAESHEKSA